MYHKGIGLFQREIPKLKKASFTGMEKYRARKLLRGLLSLPVHVEMHYVLATVLDLNLSFTNSLSCVLGKWEGCVVYLCVMKEGEQRKVLAGGIYMPLEPNCFLGPHRQLPERSWETGQLIWAEGTCKSSRLWGRAKSACWQQKPVLHVHTRWLIASLLIFLARGLSLFHSTNVYPATTYPCRHCFRHWGICQETKDKHLYASGDCILAEGNGHWIKSINYMSEDTEKHKAEESEQRMLRRAGLG